MGVRTTITEEQLREILTSSDSANSPPRSFSGHSGSPGEHSGASRGSDNFDDALSLPSEMLAELASPRSGRAPRAWAAAGAAAAAPGFSHELLAECVAFSQRGKRAPPLPSTP